MTRPISELGLDSSLEQDTKVEQEHSSELSLNATQSEQTIISEQSELSNNIDHIRLITENMQDLVCMHDATGKLLYVASSCENLLGYTSDELVNQFPKQFIHPSDLIKIDAALKEFNDNAAGHTSHNKHKPILNFQFRVIHKNGDLKWLDCQLQGIFDEAGTLIAAISTSKDISKSYKTEKQLRYQATHDLLTGLNNRRLFKERLTQTLDELSSSSQNELKKEKQIAVIHIDIDRFKIINETLGHKTGDKLLQAIASRIRNEVHFDDLVARLGGDEFVILLFDVDNRNDAIKVAERIQEKIQKAFIVNNQDVFVTASIGVVFSIVQTNQLNTDPKNDSANTTYTNANDMLGDAEISMYRSKAAGKARYTVFDKTLHKDENAGRRLQLESDLRTALANNELFPLYHPILILPSNKLTGFEVLLRWQHPELGLVSPGEFIPLAEETGLITDITLWLLEKACGELVTWQEQAGFDLNLSINLSPRMFSIPDIDVQLSDIIEKFPLNPKSINLEITEGLLMEDMAYGAELLNRLRKRGLRTHIDDFGTGYCSLSYLHTLPIDALKIDKSFISGKGELHSGIVQTIISLAHNLEIPAIAEGIEDTKQLSILNDLNCDQAQGFLFSKPISVSDVNNFLEKHTSSGYIVEFEGLENLGAPKLSK